MGEARKDALRLGFDRAIKLEFHGARVSSDAGLFPYRDLDDAARLTESVAADLFDFRTGNNIRHSMTALVRQSVFSRLAGYEDTNDAERLSEDPVMRHVIGGRAVEQGRQVRGELDPPVLPRLRRQPGPAATVCAGVQPGQLLPPLGVARKREALDADHAAREADQDRGEGHMGNVVHTIFDVNWDTCINAVLQTLKYRAAIMAT